MNYNQGEDIKHLLFENIATVLTLPTLLLFEIQAKVVGRQLAFQGLSERISRWPGLTGILLRRGVYRKVLENGMGDRVVISYGSVLSRATAKFGNRVYVGWYCTFGDVDVGDDVLFADYVSVPSGSHQHGTSRVDIPIREQEGRYKVIHIGNDCWIGSESVILADIGDHCIVGAGSVVTKPFPEYQIIAGNPAKAIGDRRAVNTTSDVNNGHES